MTAVFSFLWRIFPRPHHPGFYLMADRCLIIFRRLPARNTHLGRAQDERTSACFSGPVRRVILSVLRPSGQNAPFSPGNRPFPLRRREYRPLFWARCPKACPEGMCRRHAHSTGRRGRPARSCSGARRGVGPVPSHSSVGSKPRRPRFRRADCAQRDIKAFILTIPSSPA